MMRFRISFIRNGVYDKILPYMGVSLPSTDTYMPSASQMLKQAYSLADGGRIEEAITLLDMLVRREPKQVEAWEFYLQICSTIEQLKKVGDSVSASKDIDSRDKKEILDYYRYLLKEKGQLPVQVDSDQSALYLIPIGLTILLLVLWGGKMGLSIEQLGALLFVGSLIILGVYFIHKSTQQKNTSRGN
jgi:hypothetical protein